jgi:MYXO-CTERM domain-containing protein
MYCNPGEAPAGACLAGCVYYNLVGGGFDNCPDGSVCDETNGALGTCVSTADGGAEAGADGGGADGGAEAGGPTDAGSDGQPDGSPSGPDAAADATMGDDGPSAPTDDGDLRGGGGCAVPDGGRATGGALALAGLAALAVRRRRKR